MKVFFSVFQNFDIQALRARIKKRGLTVPKLPAQKIETLVEFSDINKKQCILGIVRF